MPVIVNTSPLLNVEHGEAADILRATGYPVLTNLFNPRRSATEMGDLLKDAVAAIVSMDPLTAETLDEAPHLRVIARTGVGYDAIDVAAATARNIVVCTAVGSNDRSVAELTWGLILALARRIPQQVAEIRAGGWQRTFDMELWGKTLGIVGFGSVGQAVARRGLGFEMRVLAADVRPNHAAAQALGVTFGNLPALLTESDIVTLHVSLDAGSRGLIGATELRLMKPTALLINTSRGSVIDEVALMVALQNGQIAGAGLDVLSAEPPGESLMPYLQLPNLICTAHCAGTTRESVARAALMAAQNVARVLEGREPLSAINAHLLTRGALRQQ